MLTGCQWHDFLHRGAAWRKIAHEFQCYMFCKESLAEGTWISVVQHYTAGLVLHGTQAVLSVQ